MDAEKMMMLRRIDNLMEQLELVKRQRDAAVNDVDRDCHTCKYNGTGAMEGNCSFCAPNGSAECACCQCMCASKWVWRGLCKENGGVEMASDLISRSALIEDCLNRLNEFDMDAFAFENCFPYWIFKKAITKAPAVDAVEVVRCKDCEKCDTDWCPSHSAKLEYWCGMIGLVTEPDFFCGYGERKKEDAVD